MKVCEVAKVHAVWEPPRTGTVNAYNPSKVIQGKEFERALEITEASGLRVARWIYSQADYRQQAVEECAVMTRILFQSLRRIHTVHGAKRN
jgi:hypothetical protein